MWNQALLLDVNCSVINFFTAKYLKDETSANLQRLQKNKEAVMLVIFACRCDTSKQLSHQKLLMWFIKKKNPSDCKGKIMLVWRNPKDAVLWSCWVRLWTEEWSHFITKTTTRKHRVSSEVQHNEGVLHSTSTSILSDVLEDNKKIKNWI